MENLDQQMAFRALKMKKLEKEILLLDKQLMWPPLISAPTKNTMINIIRVSFRLKEPFAPAVSMPPAGSGCTFRTFTLAPWRWVESSVCVLAELRRRLSLCPLFPETSSVWSPAPESGPQNEIITSRDSDLRRGVTGSNSSLSPAACTTLHLFCYNFYYLDIYCVYLCQHLCFYLNHLLWFNLHPTSAETQWNGAQWIH